MTIATKLSKLIFVRIREDAYLYSSVESENF
jgi:hypothetical protein